MADAVGEQRVASATRRERVRAATVEEIKATARRLLVAEGPSSVTLRAIAREMGMTAPGLYRYFPSHEDLVRAVVADVYDELADGLVQARDLVPEDDPAGRLIVMSRRFRLWAVNNRSEFSLVFATPLGGVMTEMPSAVDKAGSRFGGVFIEAFVKLWKLQPFPIPGDDELPADLFRQLTNYRTFLAGQFGPYTLTIPIGTLLRFLQCWVQLYGMVALEVFDHLHFCLDNPEPAFELQLQGLARSLGFTARPDLPLLP